MNIMHEAPPSFEATPEHIPTPEEVVAVFEKVTGGRPYTELKRKEDEKGLYIWEIKLSEPDNEGTTTEYWYKRDGTYAQKGDSKKYQEYMWRFLIQMECRQVEVRLQNTKRMAGNTYNLLLPYLIVNRSHL